MTAILLIGSLYLLILMTLILHHPYGHHRHNSLYPRIAIWVHRLWSRHVTHLQQLRMMKEGPALYAMQTSAKNCLGLSAERDSDRKDKKHVARRKFGQVSL
jgi:hypothetical protein